MNSAEIIRKIVEESITKSDAATHGYVFDEAAQSILEKAAFSELKNLKIKNKIAKK